MKNMQCVQIKGLIEKTKSLISPQNSRTKNMRAYGTWAGFLNGLKIKNVITHEEYKILFEELEDFKESNRKEIFSHTANCEGLGGQELWNGFFDGLRITKALPDNKCKTFGAKRDI